MKLVADFIISTYSGITVYKIGNTSYDLITFIISRISSQHDEEPVEIVQLHIMTSSIAS
jgi:hypothetical protein